MRCPHDWRRVGELAGGGKREHAQKGSKKIDAHSIALWENHRIGEGKTESSAALRVVLYS